jgi:hypothetical protein
VLDSSGAAGVDAIGSCTACQPPISASVWGRAAAGRQRSCSIQPSLSTGAGGSAAHVPQQQRGHDRDNCRIPGKQASVYGMRARSRREWQWRLGRKAANEDLRSKHEGFGERPRVRRDWIETPRVGYGVPNYD